MSDIKLTNREADLIASAMEIEAVDVKKAGRLGFMALALAQTTLPHSKVEGTEFERTNGIYTLSIRVPRQVGILPYGMMPRILIAWICTEAIKTKCPNLLLGKSLNEFMIKLGLSNSGGEGGDITRIKSQAKSLFSSTISLIKVDDDRSDDFDIENISMVRRARLLWNPRKPDENSIFESHLSLTQDFFKMILDSSVPIDLRVLHSLRRSPLAMDIYVWLVYRFFILRRETLIPWRRLQSQIGAKYQPNQRGLLDFKREFIKRLKEVLLFYPQAKAIVHENGLKLYPSPFHIPQKMARMYL
ncbi:MAG: replication protein RepA [Betaproteobacteria bacterium]